MDPIGADGNLFFKGFFLVMLGLHLRTTGDDRWNAPFDIVRDGENTFTWFHTAIAEHLYGQWTNTPDGCHCENTKVWPYCLAGAGLGLQLHDLLRGTDHHSVFDRWWRDVCRSKYLHLDRAELPEAVTLYYDPILDVHHEVPVMFGMVPAPYLAPQVADDARRLFEAGMRQFGIWEPSGPIAPLGPRVSATALWMAKEWGLTALADALDTTADDHYQPTWDRTRGEFTWGFALGEPHPRGQYNGTMAAAQIASEQSWSRLATVGPGARFTEPTVVDVDFPAVALSEARWDSERRTLLVTPVPMNEHVGRQPTTFRVVKLPDPDRWHVELDDGTPVESARVGDALEVRTTAAPRRHRIRR